MNMLYFEINMSISEWRRFEAENTFFLGSSWDLDTNSWFSLFGLEGTDKLHLGDLSSLADIFEQIP